MDRCNKHAPYLSAEVLRVGDGLTRQRGQARAQTQMVGPLSFQFGNGDSQMTKLSGNLREGARYVRRGNQHPLGELMGCAPYQFGQNAFIGEFTVERGRHKYHWSTFRKPLDLGPKDGCSVVEPAIFWGGEWTRSGRDFADTC